MRRERNRHYHREWSKRNPQYYIDRAKKNKSLKPVKVKRIKSEEELAADRERARQRSHTYYWTNRERILATERSIKVTETADERERRLAKKRPIKSKYRVSKKGRLAAIRGTAKRRARMKGNTISVAPINYPKVLAEAAGLCQICFEPFGADVHFDHIIPLALGGPHTEDNLQATHPRCNQKKGARAA